MNDKERKELKARFKAEINDARYFWESRLPGKHYDATDMKNCTVNTLLLAARIVGVEFSVGELNREGDVSANEDLAKARRTYCCRD